MLVHQNILEKVIAQALESGADFAEVYVEDTRKRQYSYLNGKPDKAISGHTLGAGIRLFSGTEQIYTFTNDLSEQGLLRASRQAGAALKAGAKTKFVAPEKMQTFGEPSRLQTKDRDFQWQQLKLLDQSARAVSSLVTQVNGNMAETNKIVQIMNSEGFHRHEARNYLNTSAIVTSEENGQMETGMELM